MIRTKLGETMDTPRKPNTLMIGIVVVLLLVAGAAAVIALSNREQAVKTSEQRDIVQTQPTETSGSGDNNAVTSTGNYKDGTYQATGSYRTPGGNESIEVQLTIKGGVITESSVTQNATAGEAREYQGRFVSGYKSQVVGKKINEVSLNRVAGSSLTPIGFNNALTTIRTDANS